MLIALALGAFVICFFHVYRQPLFWLLILMPFIYKYKENHKCGIVGFIDKNKNLEILSNMLEVQLHRGPDDSGVYFDEKSGVNLDTIVFQFRI